MGAYEIRLSAESSRALSRLYSALEAKPFFRALFGLFGKLASRAAAFVVETKLSGQVLARRTAALAQSVSGMAVYGDRGLPGFRVGVFRGPALAYAAAQEHGAHVVPVRARYLAMPVGDALTASGVARYKSPRDFPGRLVFVPFRSSGIARGALYDAASLRRARLPGGRTDWEAVRKLWVLLRYVDIRPKHYLLEGVREFLPRIASELGAFIRDLAAQAMAGSAREE